MKVTSQKSPTTTPETSRASHQSTKIRIIMPSHMSKEAQLWVPRVTGCTIRPMESTRTPKVSILQTIKTQPLNRLILHPLATTTSIHMAALRINTHPRILPVRRPLLRTTMAPSQGWATATPTSMLLQHPEDTPRRCLST